MIATISLPIYTFFKNLRYLMEQKNAIYSHMEGARSYHVERRQLEEKRWVQNDFSHMGDLQIMGEMIDTVLLRVR